MKQKLVQLTENFSYLECGDNDRPNMGLVKGKNHYLVIDGGNSKGNVDLFYSYTGLHNKNGGFLVLTHHHWDHVCGASFLEMPLIAGCQIIEGIKKQQKMDWSREGIEDSCSKGIIPEFTKRNMLGELILDPSVKKHHFRIPDIGTEGKINFDLGGVHAEYFPIKSSHTSEQYSVYVREDRVLFIGDILWPNMDGPEENWYYSLKEFMQMKETLLGIDALWYVESHAAPIDRTTLSIWLLRTEWILRFILEKKGTMEDAEKEMPEELRSTTLGYEQYLTQAFKNVRE
ncbi:MAG: MBL fold metallo-hydrolase [Treponema sp.]|nr:MBL fold metallo-hydrolase [Candidatus Treponema equi]